MVKAAREELPTGAHARAEGRAEGGRDRDGGGHAGRPVMPGADPDKPVEEDEERNEEDVEKAERHPETGRFVESPKHPVITEGHAADSPGNIAATPRPADAWPGMTEHPQAGPQASPEPLGTVHTGQGADHSGTSVSAPATAVVQHLDFASGSPVAPEVHLVQQPFHGGAE